MGNNDLKEIDAGRMDPEGRGHTQIGKILGMIGTILMCISLVATCLILIFACLIPLMVGGGAHGGPR